MNPLERSEAAATAEEKSATVADVTPPAAAQPATALPANAVGGGATASEAARQKRIQNGTAFLSDSRVKGSPLSRRVNFLKSKGLTAEDIVTCFEKAGQPQTLEAIQSLIAGTGTTSHANTSTPPINTRLATVVSHHQAPPQPTHPQPGASMYLFPAAGQPFAQATAPPAAPYAAAHAPPTSHPPLPQPPPPPALPPKSDKWKDYVLAAGAVAGGAFALTKAWSHFSPFELRRRGSTTGGEDDSGRTSRSLRQVAASGSVGATRPKLSRRQVPNGGGYEVVDPQQAAFATVSSESDERGVTTAAPQRRSRSAATSNNTALPLPSLPPQPSAGSAASPAAVDGSGGNAAGQSQMKDLEDRVAALEKEVADSKAALDKERREKAELAVSNGKLKGQVTQLTRHQDKSNAEVQRLTSELASVRAELDKSRTSASALPSDTAGGVLLPSPASAAPVANDPAAAPLDEEKRLATTGHGQLSDGANPPAVVAEQPLPHTIAGDGTNQAV